MCIISLLETWVERPHTTSSLLFVPRVVPGFWSGLSRHLVELAEFKPSEFPMRFPPVLPTPFVVLCLAPHTRRSPSVDRRLVTAPHIKGARIHQRLADDVRGMSESTAPQRKIPIVFFCAPRFFRRTHHLSAVRMRAPPEMLPSGSSFPLSPPQRRRLGSPKCGALAQFRL